MRKAVEIGCILALSAMSVMGTATVIRDLNAHSPSWLSTEVRDVLHALMTETAPRMAGVTAVSVPTGATATTPKPAKTGQPEIAGTAWTAQDVTRLMGIADELVSAVTPEEWRTLGSVIDGRADTVPDAQRMVMQILDAHLSQADLQWLESRFQGRQAFGADDLKLIRDTIEEAKAELTPAEQDLVAKELAQFWPPAPSRG